MNRIHQLGNLGTCIPCSASTPLLGDGGCTCGGGCGCSRKKNLMAFLGGIAVGVISLLGFQKLTG